MNNRWNQLIYKGWSPIYDFFFNTGAFLKARQEVFRIFQFQKGQRVLFVGVGTGADLGLVNHHELQITAIDYSPDMLKQAKTKFAQSTIEFMEMDAQHLTFDDETFDVVVASLLLSVVPDPNRCFSEMERVLKPDGQILIFDKFSTEKSSKLKVMLRPLIRVLGTDIGLSFEKIVDRFQNDLHVVEDRSMMLNGMYRKIVLTKTASKMIDTKTIF